MKKAFAILLFLMVLLGLQHPVQAQEFRCSVQVNAQKLLGSTQKYSTGDKKVFEQMKQAIEDFINTRKWTNLDMEPHEKLDCSFSLILSEQNSATDFKGQVQVQLRRPVFNSTYTTGLFNYLESGDFQFTYNESQPLEFDPNTFYSNLSSTIAYYLYYMLGLYFDSFAPNGGEGFYDMARTICQSAENSGYKGWKSTESQKARYWFSENATNSAYASLKMANYSYHRLGLDMMTKDQPKARQAIIGALSDLQQLNKSHSHILSVTQFVDVKISEIVSIFTPAPAEEQKQVYFIIKDLSPVNLPKLKDFNHK